MESRGIVGATALRASGWIYVNLAIAGVSNNMSLSPRIAAGCDARFGREPGQVRKEAAISGPDSVPSFPRPLSAAKLFGGPDYFGAL